MFIPLTEVGGFMRITKLFNMQVTAHISDSIVKHNGQEHFDLTITFDHDDKQRVTIRIPRNMLEPITHFIRRKVSGFSFYMLECTVAVYCSSKRNMLLGYIVT